MYHEAMCHDQNSFVTLTYNDQHLPEHGSLQYRDVTKFIKRLRHHAKFLYYYSGEYGDDNGRPHYHLCLFGYDFSNDRFKWDRRNGIQYYRSTLLEKLWPYGFSDLSDFSYGAARYVAKYVFKKQTGDNSVRKYGIGVNKETGEIICKEPEQSRMSLKPAIGFNWFKKYHHEVLPADHVVVDGTKKPVPKYYNKMYKAMYPNAYDLVQQNRREDNKNRKLTQDQMDERELHIAINNARKTRNLNNGN